MTAKRAAVYSRVSTDEQSGPDKDSLADQERRGRAYAEAQGWQVVATFADDFTGTKALGDRPEGSRLIAAVEAGEVEAVVIVKLDRLARKATHNLAAFDLIESLGANLAIVAENIDTGTTSGRLFRTMLAGMAEFERDSIVDRMGSARYRKAARGEWPGSPVPFGYRLAVDGKSFEVEESEAAVVKRAYALRLAGLSMPELASKLTAEGHTTRPRRDKRTNTKTVRPWKTTNVYRLLAQNVYHGAGLLVHVRSNPHEADSAEEFHFEAPALVSPEDFERANVSKLGNSPLKESAEKRRNLYAWSGRIFHDHGGGSLVPMHGSTRTIGEGDSKRRERQYLCAAGRRDPETRADPNCPGFGIVQGKETTRAKADRIDALGLGFLLDLVRHPHKLKALQADRDQRRAALDVNSDRETVEARIADLDRRRTFLVNQAATDAEAGHLNREAFDVALGAVDEDLDAARAELSRLDTDAEESAKVRMSIEDILGVVSELSDEALAKLDGYTPPKGTNAPERLTVGWTWTLQNEVVEAITPGKRGATPPLSAWAVEETRWLVERLGCFVVLSKNDGNGPKLIDRESGEKVTMGLAERLKGQNAARWPNVSIGVDVTLSTQRAAARLASGESASVRYGNNQQPPRTLRVVTPGASSDDPEDREGAPHEAAVPPPLPQITTRAGGGSRLHPGRTQGRVVPCTAPDGCSMETWPQVPER